jgi:ssDNA-binding replication factor A large subunit
MVRDDMDEDLEDRVAELRREFGDLLNDEVLRRIAREEGGNIMAPIKKIADLGDKEEVSVVVKVTRINDTKTFQKRTGGEGKVRNINVEDETGTCRLTLWDEDVELPENMNIEIGTQLKLTDCYTKQTDFGLDITKGRKGKIELE